MAETLLNRPGASAHIQARGLRATPGTLAKWATVGGGPRFRKFGRDVVYDVADLDAWIDSKLSAPMASTTRGAA